ncbi:MAG: hypothetical protein ACYC7G_04340 [Rudaea sp.]
MPIRRIPVFLVRGIRGGIAACIVIRLAFGFVKRNRLTGGALIGLHDLVLDAGMAGFLRQRGDCCRGMPRPSMLCRFAAVICTLSHIPTPSTSATRAATNVRNRTYASIRLLDHAVHAR